MADALADASIARMKQADLQQICNRSVLAKTDQLQTNLSSAKSVFSLCRRSDLTVCNDLKTADGKQIMSRSAANLLSLQEICSASKSRNSHLICHLYLIYFVALALNLTMTKDCFSCQVKYILHKVAAMGCC